MEFKIIHIIHIIHLDVNHSKLNNVPIIQMLKYINCSCCFKIPKYEFQVLLVCEYPGEGILECNLTARCPFFRNLHNPFRKKICISIPCFGIIKLQKNAENNRENNNILFLKTIAFCSLTNSHNPFRNF